MLGEDAHIGEYSGYDITILKCTDIYGFKVNC